MRCSTASTRAASVSARVAGKHRHALLRDDRAGIESPARRSAPSRRAALRRRASARACVSRPVKAGSSDGWMLIMRPRQRSTNHGVSRRMKPGKADDLDAVLAPAPPAPRGRTLRDPCRTACARRTAVAMPGFACARKPAGIRRRWTAPARFRPDSPAPCAASISAAMLEPRPEIRIATRFGS